jgi:hypothetical protein
LNSSGTFGGLLKSPKGIKKACKPTFEKYFCKQIHLNS